MKEKRRNPLPSIGQQVTVLASLQAMGPPKEDCRSVKSLVVTSMLVGEGI